MGFVDAPETIPVQLLITEVAPGAGKYGLVVTAGAHRRPIGRQDFTSAQDVFETVARGLTEIAGMGVEGSRT